MLEACRNDLCAREILNSFRDKSAGVDRSNILLGKEEFGRRPKTPDISHPEWRENVREKTRFEDGEHRRRGLEVSRKRRLSSSPN